MLDNALVTSLYTAPPLVPQKVKIFRQYMTNDGTSSGSSDMRVPANVARTDGVCADHAGPTYTFTSVGGGLASAKRIIITDAGAGGHGLVGNYVVKSVNSATSVELDRDPTDGTNETGLDYYVPDTNFWIPADVDNDRYITAISFLIADAGASLNEFGAIAALTTGCVLEYNRIGEVVTIHDNLRSNWDFIRLCLGTPAFGATTNAFIASNVFGSSEGVIPVFNFATIIPPHGLKLERGTAHELILRVKDNTSAIDAFNAVAYGFERFE